MTQTEKDELLRKLNERQLQLASIMSNSDAHASKCIKLGLNFRDAYPEDYESYTKAREEYNANEEKVMSLMAEEVEEEVHIEPEQ